MATDDNNLDLIGGLTDDFDSIIDNDLKMSFTYTPVTTYNYGIDGTDRVEGVAETRYGIIFIAKRTYEGLPEGFFLDCDAVVLVKSSETYNRDDIIEIGGDKFRIKQVVKDFNYGYDFTQKLDLVMIE